MGLSIYNQDGSRSRIRIAPPSAPPGWFDTNNQGDYIINDTLDFRVTANIPYRAVNNKIYFPTPLTLSQAYIGKVFTYDLNTGLFEEDFDLAYNNGSVTGRWLGNDDMIYLPSLYGTHGTILRYDPTNKTETQLGSNGNTANGPATYDPVNHRLYTFNGQYGNSGTQYYFDLNTNSFVSISNALRDMYGSSAWYYDGDIYIYVTAVDVAGRDILKYNISSDSWTTFSTNPDGLSISKLWEFNDELYTLTHGCDVYKWNGSSWINQQIPKPNTILRNPITSVVDNTVWCFGGYDETDTVLTTTQVLKFT